MSLEQEKIDLARYRLSKADERIKAACGMLDLSLYADAIGRSYYAIFTSTRALLALLGLDSEKHSGIISFFNRYWVKTGIMPKESSVIIADAKRDREASDYSDYVEFTCEEAEAQLAQAKEFIRQTREVVEKAISGDISLPKVE
ncbi:HEPN domain-containing protein [bacterium]|nr:HEPN domain-containing protein [bacterium]MBU1782748.1 HEPN domain-containing protein [bacterium]